MGYAYKKIDWYKIGDWMFVGLIMITIFFFSSQVGETSSELSSGVAAVLLRVFQSMLSWVWWDYDFNHFIRKCAHFTIYFTLGIAMIRALEREPVSLKKRVLWAVIFCCLYAMTDEFHQRFVPGRSGQISDVLLDTMGSIVGIISFYSTKVLVIQSTKKNTESFRRKDEQTF